MIRTVLASVMSGSMLVACSASIPVTRIGAGKAPKHEGTLLVLPRTALTLKYNVTSATYTAGTWTDEVETCGKLLAFDEKTTPDARRARLGDPQLPPSCSRLHDLGLESKRPSLAPNAVACSDAGRNTETRTSIDGTTVSVVSAALPDPDQVYWVATPARWLGDVDVTVKYTPIGTIDGAKAMATNPWSDFAVNVTGMALKAALPGIGSAPARSGAKKPPDGCAVLAPAECAAFNVDLDDLKKYVGERYQAAMLGAGPGFEKQMEVFDTRVKAQRALFEGSISARVTPKSVTWFPSARTGKDAVPANCRHALASDKTVTDGSPLDADWSCALAPEPFERVCPSPDGTLPAPDFPRDVLAASAWITAAGGLSRQSYSPALDASRAGFDRKEDDRDARGFPYRMPVETVVGAALRTCTDTKTCKGRGAMAPSALAIAQYGELGRLTPRAGGRKGTIEVKYYADSGALTTVQVSGEGSSAKPITDVLQAKLTPAADPSAMDVLKAEKERVEALSAVCKAYLNLSAEPPDYCK